MEERAQKQILVNISLDPFQKITLKLSVPHLKGDKECIDKAHDDDYSRSVTVSRKVIETSRERIGGRMSQSRISP